MTALTLISPSVSVTGSIEHEEAADRRIAPVEDELQPAVEPAQPGQRQEQLNHGPDQDREGVDVELRVLALEPGHAEPEADDDREVPEDRSQRRHREVVVGVEDPDDDAAQPEQHDDREQHAREADGEVEVAAGVAERPDQQRRDQDEERGEAAEHEEDEPEDRRGDPPGPLPLALLEQVAEDGYERAGESCVREEGTHEVRDLERDGERVDLPVDPEVVRRDHLAHEPEHPGEARRDGEDQPWSGQAVCGAGGAGADAPAGSAASFMPVEFGADTLSTFARTAALALRVVAEAPRTALLRSFRPRGRGHSYARRADAEHPATEEARPDRLAAAEREPPLPVDDQDAHQAARERRSPTVTRDGIAAEHLALVRLIDKAASRGAIHKNTAARKKAQAARLVATLAAAPAA